MLDPTPTFSNFMADLGVVLGITLGLVVVLGLIFGLHTVTDLLFLAFAIHTTITTVQTFSGWRIKPAKKGPKVPKTETEKHLKERELFDFREADFRVALFGISAIVSLGLSLLTSDLGR